MRRLIIISLLISFYFTSRAQQLYTTPTTQSSGMSSFENPGGLKGGGGKANKGAKGHAFDHLKAGESINLLEIHEPGVIQRIWMTLSDRSFDMLRSLRLRIYWDKDTTAAVDVPLGDFMCAPLGKLTPFHSALFSSPEGRSFNCYIPMPFRRGARVVLTNEGSTDLISLYYDIDFITTKVPPKDMLYFQACWNREIHGPLGKDFALLPLVKGKGRFLGVNVGVNTDSSYRNTWWGEGEVKMYIDGDSTQPTINGTGTEDYIGDGWGLSTFSDLYQGCLIADERSGQYSFYRFHVPDQIFFYKDFRAAIPKMGNAYDSDVRQLKNAGATVVPTSVATGFSFTPLLEHPVDINDPAFPHGWTNFYRIDDYSATAYFYLERTSSGLPALAPLGERVK